MSTSVNPIKTLLVDDEQAVRSGLREMLHHHFPYIDVVAEAASIPEAVREIHQHKPELIFLDIEMPGYSGLQLIDFFNPQEITFDIIFVTAFSEYAIRAFKISAFDYLLKPVEHTELESTLTHYVKKRHQHTLNERVNLLRSSLAEQDQVKQIAISSLQGIEFVPFSDILALEASGTYTVIRLVIGETITSSKPLGEFEDALKLSSIFFRPHRSYIINLQQVKKLTTREGDVIIMRNDMQIPLSRYRKKEFDAVIAAFRV